MVLDDPVRRSAHVGLYHGGREIRVVLRRQHVADIVQQRRHDDLVLGAVAERAGRGLQRMLVAVDLVSLVAAMEQREVGQNAIRGRRDEGLRQLRHHGVVLGGAVLHPDVAHGAFRGGEAVGHR